MRAQRTAERKVEMKVGRLAPYLVKGQLKEKMELEWAYGMVSR